MTKHLNCFKCALDKKRIRLEKIIFSFLESESLVLLTTVMNTDVDIDEARQILELFMNKSK